jgi:hypothetical protein
MAPVGLFGFWAGLYLASRRYPSEYDWRYMTISSLLYPDRDPGGYAWAWGGIVACALGGLCWVSVLCSGGHSIGGGNKRMLPGIWALGVGYLCMVSCAVWPGRLLHLPRGHDLLALLAFVGICVGTVHLTYEWLEQKLRRREGASRAGARIYAALAATVALAPLFLEAVTQADVARAFPHLPWVGLEWRARGVPMYLSFAFWEWSTCLVFSAYITMLSLATLREQKSWTLRPRGTNSGQ